MKSTLKIIFVLCFVSSISFAQKIAYAYDASGNRIQRKFDMNPFKVGKKDSTQSVSEFPKILMEEGISVFPNPTSDKIVLTLNTYEPSETNSMSLLDAKGVVVMSQKLTEQKSEMDVSHLTAGVYFFKVIKNKKMLYYKIVKM